jgi:hypothetical protein
MEIKDSLSTPTIFLKKGKQENLNNNKIEQADRGREYTLSPRIGTLIIFMIIITIKVKIK